MTEKKRELTLQDIEVVEQCMAFAHALLDVMGGKFSEGGVETTHDDLNEIGAFLLQKKKKELSKRQTSLNQSAQSQPRSK